MFELQPERKDATMEPMELLKVIWPAIVLNYALVIWALLDLRRRNKVRYIPKVAWALVILFVQALGPISYLAIGRGE